MVDDEVPGIYVRGEMPISCSLETTNYFHEWAHGEKNVWRGKEPSRKATSHQMIAEAKKPVAR